MNCKVFFRILAIGAIAILISAFAYAAEDHLSISPSTSDLEAGMIYARPGKLEVTISGARDSDEAAVIGVSYFVNYCCGGTYIGIPQLTVKATIEEGKNPGKSIYEKKFPVDLQPGAYSLLFQIRDSLFSGDYEAVDMGGIEYLSVTEAPIPINIENITRATITESDTFMLEGITVPGYTEKYWGTFKWNPDALSFDLMDAGVGTGVSR